MGFLDALRGKKKLRQPTDDRLFAMSTAIVTLETELGLKHEGRAAIVFQPLGTADFDAIVKDMEEVLGATGTTPGRRSSVATTPSATAGWSSTTRTSRTSSSA